MSDGWQRILITGGAGLIGSHIVDLLIQERLILGCQQIIVLDNFTRGHLDNVSAARPDGFVTIVDGDIRDQQVVNEVMRGVDLVFHQAAIRITQCAEEPRLALEVLTTGTFNVLEAAVHAGVRKIIAASSASVYGLAEVFPTDEQHHPYNNRTLYGAAKVFNEGLLRSFYEMYGLNYVALRYFNCLWAAHGYLWRVYRGAHPLDGAYRGRSTADDLRKRLTNHGFCVCRRCGACQYSCCEGSVVDEVFNVASGVETSLNELAQSLISIMGSTITRPRP